jgi:hypothetical protein
MNIGNVYDEQTELAELDRLGRQERTEKDNVK